MKNMQTKIPRWMLSTFIGLAMSTSVGFGMPTITVDTFDTGGTIVNNMWQWYGGADFWWDASQDHTGNSGGSLYITHPVAAGADTIIVPEVIHGGVWWFSPVYTDLTLYTSASCWFKWDTISSTMTVNNFNTQGNGGFSIALIDAPTAWSSHPLPFQQIAGSGSWEHLNFPIVNTIPHIDQIVGLAYYDWKPAPWSGTVAFWIDDVLFESTLCDCPLPAPTIKSVSGTTTGLNVFMIEVGSSFYDRQSVYCLPNTGVSWWDVATPGNPVDYKFTIASMPGPASATHGCEAWMFLSPNPSGLEVAPDWTEANMVIAFVQQDSSGNATLHFQYKVNEPNQQQMYYGGHDTVVVPGVSTNYMYWTSPVGSQPGGPITVSMAPGINNITNETGDLGSVTNPATAAGTWTIRFTSNTNVTLIAPGGDTRNLVITPYYANFLNPAGVMNLYLGGQPNNASAFNKPVVYSRFQLSGTPAEINDNFATDTTLDTNIWSRAQATVPAGVLVVPGGVEYFVTWTLPAVGYSLEAGNQLTDLSVWGAPSLYPQIPMFGMMGQFVDSTEVPPGPNVFFNLIKRAFSQLQVILPGETPAPVTLTGKTGTPTAVSLGAGGLVNVAVNACDATWHKINGVADTVHLSTTDGASVIPANAGLVNGTVTFAPLHFNTAGSQTITATDLTDGSKTPNTSTPVTVGL